MTGTNEMADLKIRLERLERTVAEQAATIRKQDETLAAHDMKLELLKTVFTLSIKEISAQLKQANKAAETVAEAHLRHLMDHAAEKLNLQPTAPGEPRSREQTRAIVGSLFGDRLTDAQAEDAVSSLS